MTSAARAGSSEEAGKVETVYVTANASGAVDDVIVSEWLKNANSSAELSDTTELKNIVNVKGKEGFTENSDGSVTWDANGSDIYYQGTTDKELPVDMKITGSKSVRSLPKIWPARAERLQSVSSMKTKRNRQLMLTEKRLRSTHHLQWFQV